MKFIYFDCSSGASGDMILASLLSLGVPLEEFKRALKSLKLKVDIQARTASSGGFSGLRIEVITRAAERARNYSEVKKIIENSDLPVSVKLKAIRVFRRLFQAESVVHGRSFRTAHLHEAAADDALVDIVGTCWLLERLMVSQVYFSPTNLGGGFVKTSHGLLPVPPPAVAELMKGFPVYSSGEEVELLTPTGAALLTTLGKSLIHWPELIYEKIGYGLGHRQLKFQPNVLRAFYGPLESFKPEKRIMVVEANLDDASPQLLGNFLNLALKLGALEAFLTPVVMKKNRLGSKLTLIAEIDKIDTLIEAIFRETTTIGVRYYPVERRTLRREIREVDWQGQKVRIKISYLGQEIINYQPEFDDCLKVAEKLNLPVKMVINEVIKKLKLRGKNGQSEK
ncbi:MAG: nickel pincer cofactor biosynthesis protein LarC [Candidatus Saccharicenans sp.]